jgi:hypothetical protein
MPLGSEKVLTAGGGTRMRASGGGGGVRVQVPSQEAYDDVKVQAVLNQIDGKRSDGSAGPGVPAIFGMNFQAVSVGQKLPVGGYAANGAPSANLENAIAHTDASIGRMLQALEARELWSSTLVIVSAKHGQSPIDRSKLAMEGSPQAAISDVQDPQGFINNVPLRRPHLGRPDRVRARAERVHPARRRRDLLGSSKKIAEHGGGAPGDTEVALLVAGGSVRPGVVESRVSTTQVAPTILEALGFQPRALEAVRKEHTRPLPGLGMPSWSSSALANSGSLH